MRVALACTHHGAGRCDDGCWRRQAQLRDTGQQRRQRAPRGEHQAGRAAAQQVVLGMTVLSVLVVQEEVLQAIVVVVVVEGVVAAVAEQAVGGHEGGKVRPVEVQMEVVWV